MGGLGSKGDRVKGRRATRLRVSGQGSRKEFSVECLRARVSGYNVQGAGYRLQG